LENQGMSNNSDRCSIQIEDGVSGGQAFVSNGFVSPRNRQMVGNSRNQSESERRNSNPSSWRKDKRYETWPSPKTRKRSLKRSQNNNAKSFSNADTVNILQADRIVNEIPVKKCRTCSSSSLDGLTDRNKRMNLNIKDNRLKSNIRSHAMAATDRRRSMAFDQGAVEALSKEDLLVLWKRSEIDLQTRLNRMLHQNSHLRRLVQLAEDYQRRSFHRRTRQEKDARIRKVSNGYVRQMNENPMQQSHNITSHLTKVSVVIEDDDDGGENKQQFNTRENNSSTESTLNLEDEKSVKGSDAKITRDCNEILTEHLEDEKSDQRRDAKISRDFNEILTEHKDENKFKDDVKERKSNDANERLNLSELTEQSSEDNIGTDGTDQEDDDYYIMTTRL
jgi:hypothetical protein